MYYTSFSSSWWLLALIIPFSVSMAEADEIKKNNSFSAVFVFGDSTVDSGNNNYIDSLIKSNFPPYGMDFVNRTPTGRFTDGRLVTDFIASYAGIKEFVPPYLDPNLSLEEMMTGVCFASACSGFDPLTSQMTGVISVQKQLEYFKEFKSKVESSIGKERTKDLINKAAFLLSAGTNDFVNNYHFTPFRRQMYNITQFQQFVLEKQLQFIQGLINEGARVIGLVGLPPMGCLPMVITFAHPFGKRKCVDSLSNIALDYNEKLQNKIKDMQTKDGPGIFYFDIYQPLDDMIQNPSQYGLDHVNNGCCGSGYVETTFLCNRLSHLCSNTSKYLFFDSIHPTEVTYKHLFEAMKPKIDEVLQGQ